MVLGMVAGPPGVGVVKIPTLEAAGIVLTAQGNIGGSWVENVMMSPVGNYRQRGGGRCGLTSQR